MNHYHILKNILEIKWENKNKKEQRPFWFCSNFWFYVVLTKIYIFLEHTTYEPLLLPYSEQVIWMGRDSYIGYESRIVRSEEIIKFCLAIRAPIRLYHTVIRIIITFWLQVRTVMVHIQRTLSDFWEKIQNLHFMNGSLSSENT